MEWTVEDVRGKVQSKFNEDIAKKFEEQEIDGKALIFLAKEGSASQFIACGLSTVGEQMRLKELVCELPIVVTKAGHQKKPSKATIKQLSEMNQRIYKAKRKAIRAAVIKTWPGNNIPTFKNNNKSEEQLQNLVEDLNEECSFPVLGFGKEGIKQHVLDILNERRRHVRKGHDYSVPDKRTLKRKADMNESTSGSSSAADVSDQPDSCNQTLKRKVKSSESTSSGSSSAVDLSDQSGDTVSVIDEDSSSTSDEEGTCSYNEDSSKEIGLEMIVATTIICVMYNAIKITDVRRSQLQSSGRKLGLKNLNKEDKDTLVCLVAKSLLDSGYVKIVPGKSRNPTRDDIIKLKPF